MTAEQIEDLGMLQLAKAQYEETLVAVHVALDQTVGRAHRTCDDSAAASIHRLAVEAERRGAVKVLNKILDSTDEGRTYSGLDIIFSLATLLNGIESGEVTLP